MTDLIHRLRSQEAVDGTPREIELLTDEAAEALEASNSRIAELEAQTQAKRGTDAQILWERELTASAINGAMAYGYQGTNAPPSDDHWLAPFWKIGRKHAELEALVPLSVAARDVIAERQRQTAVENWTAEHDDGHNPGILSVSAACYALQVAADLSSTESAYWSRTFGRAARELWQFDVEWWKPGTPRRMLEKAGAMILAEMEKIDRAARATAKETGEPA